jgi:uncharacterized protein YoaH (UPF0181 family)
MWQGVDSECGMGSVDGVINFVAENIRAEHSESIS